MPCVQDPVVVHDDLGEDGADAMRQCRDKERGLPVLASRAADGPAVDRDHQVAVGCRAWYTTRRSAPVEHIDVDQRKREPEGGLLRRAAGRAQHGQDLRADGGGPLPVDGAGRAAPRRAATTLTWRSLGWSRLLGRGDFWDLAGRLAWVVVGRVVRAGAGELAAGG
jgi:hypothetical protein